MEQTLLILKTVDGTLIDKVVAGVPSKPLSNYALFKKQGKPITIKKVLHETLQALNKVNL